MRIDSYWLKDWESVIDRRWRTQSKEIFRVLSPSKVKAVFLFDFKLPSFYKYSLDICKIYEILNLYLK